MPRGNNFAFSIQSLLGLFYIHRYTFLTIPQFARITGYNYSTASDQLRLLERHKILGHFGNIALAGAVKAPKVYFLTRKGWEILNEEADLPQELISKFKQVHTASKWSPQMFHRLKTIDLMISAEMAVRERKHLSMVKTFIEYRVKKQGEKLTRETTDFVDQDESIENKIVPDAVFILENIETQKRALFFIEMDMATERIVSFITRDSRITLLHKIKQYDRYLQNMRYRQTYAPFGDFRHFTLLFVTLGEERIDNIRRELQVLPKELASYYRFATYEQAMGDFLGKIWKSRLLSDPQIYPLVR
jgi:hypothetical protein